MSVLLGCLWNTGSPGIGTTALRPDPSCQLAGTRCDAIDELPIDVEKGFTVVELPQAQPESTVSVPFPPLEISTMRIGHGYDSHRFAAGRRLVLGGVEIPSERGLYGHSDADAVAH